MPLYIVHVLRIRCVYAAYTQLYIARMLGRHSVDAAHTLSIVHVLLRLRSVYAAYTSHMLGRHSVYTAYS